MSHRVHRGHRGKRKFDKKQAWIEKLGLMRSKLARLYHDKLASLSWSSSFSGPVSAL
jgi:hypothetical protein